MRFRLDPEGERLWDGGSAIQMTQKAFEILQLFVENPDRLLTKAEIQGSIWSGVHVAEGLIKEYVHDLRRLLGDDPRSPRFIETVRGRGYRFIGSIDLATGEPDPSLSRLAMTDQPTLAVLPVINLTGRDELETFCRCLRADLVTDLVNSPDVVVVDAGERNSGASYLLEGTAQASGDRLTISMHLRRAPEGEIVWADRYEPGGWQTSELQQQVVGRVVSALTGFEGRIIRSELRTLKRKPIQDLNAHALYLLALDLLLHSRKEEMFRASELCRRALSLDPEHARAWLLMGWIDYRIGTERWAPNSRHYLKSQRENYLKAHRADPGDALATMEVALLRGKDGDVLAARDGLERAVELGRNQSELLTTISKYFCMIADDPSRAMELASKSFRFCAYPPEFHFQHLTRAAYFAGEFETGLDAARRGPDVLSVRLFEILCLAQLGRHGELHPLRENFGRRYSDFSAVDFASEPPIIGTRARTLFADGAAKAALV